MQSGYATVSRALQHESLGATERAELIAAPLLLIVLLLVFRSLIAAAIPLALGALTVLAGRGVLVLLGSVMTIDALSLVVCTMMGLALGVDYSLLIVSRFREELARGRRRERRPLATRATAGRTTLFAGATLSSRSSPPPSCSPARCCSRWRRPRVVVTAISVAHLDLACRRRWRCLGRGSTRARSAAAGERGARGRRRADAALRRPALAAVLIAVPLALLAIPALAFNTGAPGIEELPASSEARQDSEAIDRAVGPGWEAPFVLVAASREGPITTPPHSPCWPAAAPHRRQPGVQAVIGPAPIARRRAPLRALGEQLLDRRRDGAGELARLGPGLRRAAGAVEGCARASPAAAGQRPARRGLRTRRRRRRALAAGLERAAAGGTARLPALGRLADGTSGSPRDSAEPRSAPSP